MRKQTKLVAVLSAAALLAIGASMTSFAAAGWAEEDGTWVYLDSDGDRVTEDWKKSGNQYFWLNEDGEMATSSIIEDDDDKYYVDENGARVINQWISTENEDDWEDVESVWYYFGSTGKAYEGKKTVNGKTYIFDEGGYMFSGWHEYELSDGVKTEMYYLGAENEGWAVTGWQLLEPSDEMVPNADADEYDDEEWFNFKSSGVLRAAAEGKETTRAYIDGSYYAFDESGVMVSGWAPPVATPDGAFYTESGNQPKGWVYTYKQEDKNGDGDQEWFYLDSKGLAFNAGKETVGTALKHVEGNVGSDSVVENVAAKYIKSKTYLFNGDGVMLSGVYYLDKVVRNGGGVSTMDPGIYYFNKGDGSVKGQLETGKTTVTYDGENFYYYFASTGLAYNNQIVDGCLYGASGARVSSDEGNMLYPIDEDVIIYAKDGKTDLKLSGKQIIISASGKVKKSGTVTIDGTKYTVGGKTLGDYVAEEVKED